MENIGISGCLCDDVGIGNIADGDQMNMLLDLENNNVMEYYDNKINEVKQLVLDQNREREKDRKYLRHIDMSVNEVKDQGEELLNKVFIIEKHCKNMISDIKDMRRELEHTISSHSEEELKHSSSPLLSRKGIERSEKCASNEDKPSRLLSVLYFKSSD